MLHLRRLSVLCLAFAVLALGSCTTSDTPTGVSSPPASAPDQLLGELPLVSGLLSCSPLPYASDHEVMGPAGGTLVLGPHRLVVPAGALSQSVLVSGDAPVGNVNSVRLFPEGLRFAKPARLVMSYRNCSLLGVLTPKHIAYTTEQLFILRLLPTIDDFLHQRLTSNLGHFSRYAVAW
ncbi:MAG: hypothetical protein ACREMO_02670 [Gemmatimonadales bacterium]